MAKSEKKIDPNLPPEVQAYAKAERRERMGMAWLVGIVSLVVALIVFALLYFGGVWLYRKLAHKNSNQTNTSQTEDKSKSSKSDQDKQAEADKDKSDSAKNTGSTEPNDSSTSSNSTSTPAQATGPATGPVTGDDSEDTLVRTGPDIDL